uniref:Uncharacterized protein n=1 Tax=Cannabis sativa TaxID=3483 RepID=A0A803P1P8_CANSA
MPLASIPLFTFFGTSNRSSLSFKSYLLHKTSSPFWSDTISFAVDGCCKAPTHILLSTVRSKSAMEGAGSLEATSDSFARKRQKLVKEREANRALKRRRLKATESTREALCSSAVRKIEISEGVHTPNPTVTIKVEALEKSLEYKVGLEAAPFAAKLLDHVARSASKLPMKAWASSSSTYIVSLAHSTKRLAAVNRYLEEENSTKHCFITEHEGCSAIFTVVADI